MGNNMKKNILVEGFKMACELLALAILDYLYSDCSEETSCDLEVSTRCEFPGAIDQDEEAKEMFIETLHMYLRAASIRGKWDLDSDRDDLGVEVIGHDKMTLHLVNVEG